MRRALLTAAALLASAAAFSSSAQTAAPTLEPLWTISGFDSPESVLPTRGGYFVSNVGGEGDARDGDGWIALVGVGDGHAIARWVAGLDAPKGMALKDGKLYVSDITKLVVIDVARETIIARHDVPDSAFLNDVAVAPDGKVLVADSGKQRIYAFDGTAATPWLEDPLLRSINGLLPEKDRLVVSTMQGRLLAVDWKTKAITVLAEGLGNGDGLARLKDGTYIVSEWPGRLFHVRADGTHAVIADTRQQEQFWNDFLLVGDTLVVPNWKPGTLSAYRVRD